MYRARTQPNSALPSASFRPRRPASEKSTHGTQHLRCPRRYLSMTLFEAVRNTIRRLHYSPRTEEAHLQWIRAFIRFHSGRHPREMAAPETTAFPSHLAVHRRVSASTQNQALCAIVFLYKRVLNLEIPALDGLSRTRDLIATRNQSQKRRRCRPSTSKRWRGHPPTREALPNCSPVPPTRPGATPIHSPDHAPARRAPIHQSRAAPTSDDATPNQSAEAQPAIRGLNNQSTEGPPSLQRLKNQSPEAPTSAPTLLRNPGREHVELELAGPRDVASPALRLDHRVGVAERGVALENDGELHVLLPGKARRAIAESKGSFVGGARGSRPCQRPCGG